MSERKRPIIVTVCLSEAGVEALRVAARERSSLAGVDVRPTTLAASILHVALGLHPDGSPKSPPPAPPSPGAPAAPVPPLAPSPATTPTEEAPPLASAPPAPTEPEPEAAEEAGPLEDDGAEDGGGEDAAPAEEGEAAEVDAALTKARAIAAKIPSSIKSLDAPGRQKAAAQWIARIVTDTGVSVDLARDVLFAERRRLSLRRFDVYPDAPPPAPRGRRAPRSP